MINSPSHDFPVNNHTITWCKHCINCGLVSVSSYWHYVFRINKKLYFNDFQLKPREENRTANLPTPGYLHKLSIKLVLLNKDVKLANGVLESQNKSVICFIADETWMLALTTRHPNSYTSFILQYNLLRLK